MRRLFVLVLIWFCALMPTPAFADAIAHSIGRADTGQPASIPNDSIPSDTGRDSSSPDTTIDNSFLDTERDLTDCLNNSIDLPGCGRAPTQEGDRGGGLQLATFGLLALAIAFITWRVARAIKARDAALAAKVH